MAVKRQQQWLGNSRVDSPFLRSLESGVAADFDTLATILTAKQPLITSGFNLITTGITKATDLQLKVASSSLIHYQATDSGSILTVPDNQANEQLISTNPNVLGGFAPSQINYVGIDLIRTVDDTTADLVMFIDSSTLLEAPKEVPLARILNYRIIISTTDFNSMPTVAPVAKVSTDGSNNILLVEDARNIFWRLGSGGTSPNPGNTYSWPTGRNEATYSDAFLGADKSINSLKNWINATLSLIWESKGGEYWYSPTSDKNVKFIAQGSIFGNGDWFEWVSNNLHWKGLSFLFDNSTGHVNQVADQTSNSAGLTDLADGDCIYVDLDRTQDRTGGSALTAVKAPLLTLGSGNVPGSRYIIAWRNGTDVFTRNSPRPVGGGTLTPATTVANGVVSITATATTPTQPFATVYDTGNQWSYTGGITRGGGGSGFIGGAGDMVIGGGFNDQYIRLIPGGGGGGQNIIAQGTVPSSATAATLQIENLTPVADNTEILDISIFAKVGGVLNQYMKVESMGAIGLGTVPKIVKTPSPSGNDFVQAKCYLKTVGMTPNARTQLVILDVDGIESVIWQGLPH